MTGTGCMGSSPRRADTWSSKRPIGFDPDGQLTFEDLSGSARDALARGVLCELSRQVKTTSSGREGSIVRIRDPAEFVITR